MADRADSSSGRSLPVLACELSALSADQRRRRGELAEAIFASAVEVRDLAAGCAFQFEREQALERRLAELIALERLCCPFLTMETRVDEAADRLVVEITGGPGVREFIAAEFGGLPSRQDP
jgi:hypothetical protein